MISIYNNNNELILSVKEYEYNGSFMEDRALIANVKSPTPIEFNIGNYTYLDTDKFILYEIPDEKKISSSGSYGGAFEYSLRFLHESEDLNLCSFMDYVTFDNKIHYSNLNTFSFYGDVSELVERIRVNLNRLFPSKWTINIDSSAPTKVLNVTANNISCLQALGMANTVFGTTFTIEGRVITIGAQGRSIPEIFQYKDGLIDVSQTSQKNQMIITRLRAYGSKKNLPDGYNRKGVYPQSFFAPGLMLPNSSIEGIDYIDSVNKDEYGIREGSVYFDGKANGEEIFPSIEGMTASQLISAGVPTTAIGALDEVVSATQVLNDEQPTIDITIKDIGFDINDYIGDSPVISMRSGDSIGSDLAITEVIKEGNNYKLTVNRKSEGDFYIPNLSQHVQTGDKFVLLGIRMPDVYVLAAEQRLLAAATEYLAANDHPNITFSPKVDSKYIHENNISLSEGDLLSFIDEDLGIGGAILIDTLKINFGGQIPIYEITLSESKQIGTLQRIQNQINFLVSNSGSGSINLEQTESLIRLIGGREFLSKIEPDTAQGFIEFLQGISVKELAELTQGLEIGDYTTGLLGGGGAFKMNNGISELEVDKLTVRMVATFFEIVVSKLRHINGGLVLSRGSMTCSRVIEDADSYQCFFERGENNEISNTFVVEDQARCQVFNAGNPKFYWRLVTEVGDDWIRLSKTVGIGDSIPTAGDDIVQLGYQGKDLDHAKRLNAQIIDESGISQYVEIESFTLEGKRRNFISADGTGSQFTGKVSFKNAGEDYDLSDWAHETETAIQEAVIKATYWSIKASTPVIYKDANSATASGVHTPVTVNGELRSGTTTTQGGFITVTPNGGTEAGTATASPVTIAPANGDGKTIYTVRLYNTASKTTLLDTQTIPVVFKGARGIDAITASLSNEADVLPASPEGAVSDYTGSGTIIRVFEGATELAYGTGNGQFQVSASGSGITVGSASTSGKTRVYGVASNMTADNATITFTISGKTASGASFSITKVQSFAKSRMGASAPLLYLSSSAQVMKCNPNNTPQTGQTISIEAKLQNVTGTATFVATPYNDAGTALATITLGGTGNTRTLTNAQWLATYKRVEVVATRGSLTDKVTIYRVADGATGQNAIVGLLTNENVTLQANSAGVVSSFTSANGEFWVYNGTTKVTSGITFSKVSQTGCTAAITSTGVYSVSAMSADNATVVLRAVYGGVTIDKVLTLSKSRAGANGVSITLVDVEFAKNTTPATAPTTGWTTTAPAITGTEQLWTRTKTSYSSGNPTYSTPANITPKTGATGATGQGIDSITEEYHISSSKTTQPAQGSAGWSTTQPTWSQGQYIWSRVKVIYKNPASTVYTGYAVSSEWEAINELEIGGRNLFLNTAEDVIVVGNGGNNQITDNSIRTIGLIENGFKIGDTLTVSFKWAVDAPEDATISGDFYIRSVNPPWDLVPTRTNISRENMSGYITNTVTLSENSITLNTFQPRLSYIPTNVKLIFKDIKLEKGNKATDWTPAPEDTERELLEYQGYIEARYIRSYLKGSNINNNNTWVQIQALTKSGENVALGKTVTASATGTNLDRITNGVTDYNNTATVSNTGNVEWVQVDLGKIYYDIDSILHHNYWYSTPPTLADRIFNDTKIEVSTDGITWKTIFDSAVSGTYKETSGGKTHTQRHTSEEAQGFMRARFVRDWIKGSSTDNRNYWNEIKVVNKAGTNLAKGKIPTSDGSLINASRATDDDIDNFTYIATPSTPTLNYIQIDLGAIHYDIDYIHVWHYNGRTFNSTKTEISEDGLTWETIFDSATEGTYVEKKEGKVHTQRYSSAMAKLNTSLAKTKGFTKIGDVNFPEGLIFTSLIKLLDAGNDGDEMAGVSGIAGDYKEDPAFWAGGSYDQAIGGTANAIIRHDGSSKMGALQINTDGVLYTEDANGNKKLKINVENIPTLESLLSNTFESGAVSNIQATGISGFYDLPNAVTIPFHGSEVTFEAMLTLSATIEGYLFDGVTPENALMYARVDLYQGSTQRYYIGSFSHTSVQYIEDKNINESFVLNNTLSSIDQGTYTIRVTTSYYGPVNIARWSISESNLYWNFNAGDVRRFEIGTNGLMFFYENNHFYIVDGGTFDLRGKTNMPGVLASGTVAANGGQTNTWGAKASAGGTSTVTGGRRVPLLDLTHNEYTVQITPHTSTTPFRVGTKTATGFQALGTGAFDYTVIGRNY